MHYEHNVILISGGKIYDVSYDFNQFYEEGYVEFLG